MSLHDPINHLDWAVTALERDENRNLIVGDALDLARRALNTLKQEQQRLSDLEDEEY
jgi:hypothetical protein